MIQNWLVSKLFAKIFCPTSMKSAEEHRCQFSFFFLAKIGNYDFRRLLFTMTSFKKMTHQ